MNSSSQRSMGASSSPSINDRHHVRFRFSYQEPPSPDILPTSNPRHFEHSLRKRHNLPRVFSANLDSYILCGLSTAGVVVSCLSALFGLFHVQVFLRAYQLPYTTYSVGRVIFSILTTGSTLWGAWWLDTQVATTRLERCDLVGCLGILLAFSFLLPFGRFWKRDLGGLPWYWQALDGAHFVLSTTLYDTMSTIMTISLNSAVADDHNMTDQERINNMSCSQVYTLMCSLIVTTVGLHLFDPAGLAMFQFYVMFLVGVAIFVFGTAQSIISGAYQEFFARNSKNRIRNIWRGWTVAVPKEILLSPRKQANHGSNSNAVEDGKNSKIVWRQVIWDLWNHSNFLRWIFLEMLLEMQTHFVLTFFKTFIDQLLVDVPHLISDWSLTLLQPMHQLMTIFCWMPIRAYGYTRVYTIGLIILWLLSSITLLVATPTTATSWTLVFLCVYAVGSEALRAACFYLAMTDLVLELKQTHAQQGRLNEPSLAGLLLGATTLVCKPIQSILPILAATLLDKYPQNQRQVLFYMLVLPPWICSLFQLVVWLQYDLHPHRAHELKVELQQIHFYQQQEQQLPPTIDETFLEDASNEHSEMVPAQQPTTNGIENTPKRRMNFSPTVDPRTGRKSAVI